MNLPVDAWYKVKWRTAAGRQLPTLASDEPGPKKPLHYRRGHVCTAQSHFDGAFETGLTDTGCAIPLPATSRGTNRRYLRHSRPAPLRGAGRPSRRQSHTARRGHRRSRASRRTRAYRAGDGKAGTMYCLMAKSAKKTAVWSMSYARTPSVVVDRLDWHSGF